MNTITNTQDGEPTATVSTERQPSGPLVMEELMRLNKIVNDCEHSLLIMERLKARGRNIPPSDFNDVAAKLTGAKRDRDWLESALMRYTASRRTVIDSELPASCRHSK